MTTQRLVRPNYKSLFFAVAQALVKTGSHDGAARSLEEDGMPHLIPFVAKTGVRADLTTDGFAADVARDFAGHIASKSVVGRLDSQHPALFEVPILAAQDNSISFWRQKALPQPLGRLF